MAVFNLTGPFRDRSSFHKLTVLASALVIGGCWLLLGCAYAVHVETVTAAQKAAVSLTRMGAMPQGVRDGR